MPDSIALKYGTVTPEELNQLKQNPNYEGVPIDSTKYSVESIKATDPSDYYKTETAQYERDSAAYSKKYEDLKKEAQSRRQFESDRITQATARRNSAVSVVNTNAKRFAQTNNNPFISSFFGGAAREFTKRKAKSAIDSLNSAQFELGDAVDAYNSLTFEGSFDKYNIHTETYNKNIDSGNITQTSNDNRFIDYSRLSDQELADLGFRDAPQTQQTTNTLERLTPISKVEKIATTAEENRKAYESIRPPYQDGYQGIKITSETPGRLTRAQAQAYNQALINAQLPILYPTKQFNQQPSDKVNSPFQSLIPQAYAETQTTKYQVTDNNGKIRTFNSKQDADRFVNNYGGSVTRYQVTTPNGKNRTFNSKETADKFVDRYGIDKGVSVAGSLSSIYGKTKEQQGPSQNDSVFFVGAHAQGYKIETQRPATPIQTGISLIDNPRGLPEQIAEGSTRLFTNLASASSDFGIALQNNDFVSPKPFTDPNNPFGLPVPRKQTPTKPTAESELFEGKIPNLLDPGIAGSVVTSGGLLALGLKAPRAVSSAKNTVQGKINEAKVTKVLSGLEAPQVLQSGKVVKGPSFPNSGEFTKETYQNTKYGNANYLEKGTVTAKAVKGRPDLVKIDSNNPLQDKSVYAIVEKGKVTTIKSFEPETAGKAPTHAKIRTNPNDVFGIEASKFDLIKTEKGIYETRNKIDAKSPILEATKSSAVQPVARARTFDVNDVLLNSKDFGRYFFQESGSNIPPARPITDTLLAETKSFGTVGTKINTYPKVKDDVPTRTHKSKTPDVFQPFKTIKGKITERTPVTGRNTFFTKPTTLKYSRNKPLDTFVTDVQKNTKFIDPFADLTKGRGSKIKDISEMLGIKKKPEPFNKGYEKTDNNQVIEKPYSKESIQSQIEKEAKPKAREQDILFSAPRFLTSQYQGELVDSVLAFPQSNKQGIKSINELSIQSGLRQSTKTPTVKERDSFKIIPIGDIGIREKQKERITPIEAFITTPIQTPKTTPTTKTTPIQSSKLDIVTITDLTTTTTIPDQFPERFPTGYRLGEFGSPFAGYGGGYSGRPRRKRTGKKYIVSSLDINNVGSIETAGVETQRVSRSQSIYGIQDKAIAKARKKNEPKQKGSFKIDPFKTKPLF